MNVVLAAGRASRLGDLAPHGCKALTPVAGRPIIEWHLDALGDATIVCRSEHATLLTGYGRTVVDDSLGGAALALRAALRERVDEPVTVVFADSFFTDLPDGDHWCGVAPVGGGRSWDLVYSDGHVAYAPLPAGMTGRACVGLYRFADPWVLALRCEFVSAYLSGEVGMAPIVNNIPGLAFPVVASWQDVGDPDALAAFTSPNTSSPRT